MAAKLLDGKKLSEQILSELRRSVTELKAKSIVPCLAVVLVGNKPDSVLYVGKKQEACRQTGIESKKISLPESVSEKVLLSEIEKLNSDRGVHGILVQLPLPKQISREKILDSVSIEKDVDGLNSESLALLSAGKDCLVSCTAKGILKLIEHTGIGIQGKKACIINDSIVVGKPLAALLANKGASVKVCNKFTANIPECIAEANIVVSAVGKKNLFSGEHLKQGAIVIDAGIFLEGKKVFGDFDFASAKEKASWITPVPGGVGPMTVACLMENTVLAASRISGV
ncbi:MAG: bifunctional 5,10-methylenetetrahydrofolate dehydrogenase/5,10-methenyltetrahydrofolate cyclohydrolase [Candidatus ainarchaeum sp.]|nr:bifunctional 5,10-methylenetetrahydrofolate dehydrogenase/5,10-methenyltetrahydrofolate cyclohydrolase [Candidatus ainarchaeum sp.]